MRILIVSHIYPSRTDDVYGSFVHSQVKALLDLGCEIKVVAPTAAAPFPLYVFKEKWRRFHETPKQDNYDGVDVVYPRVIRTPGAAFFELAGLNYYSVMKKTILEEHEKQPFALMHAQVAYPDGWAAAKLAEEMQLPLLLTLHGQELQKIVNWSEKLKKMVQNTLSAAAAVVVPSPKMLDLALKNGVSQDKVHLIYNGVDVLSGGRLPEEIAERIRDKKVLLSVGRLEKEKGFQHNVEALNILRDTYPDLVYVVVGDGAYKTKLQELAKELNLKDRVIFAGQQSRENVQAFYRNSHLFSMPSRDESFGIVYLEAMTAGLPIIGTNGEGITALLAENPVGRLVEHGDSNGLAQAVSELLDPALAREMGNKGRALAAGFTWEHSAGELFKLYKSVSRVMT